MGLHQQHYSACGGRNRDRSDRKTIRRSSWVLAVETESGRTLAYRADERFLMCSTFKGLLAALILSRVDAGQEALTRLVP